MKLLEKGALRIDGRGFEHTTTVYNLDGTLGKFGPWVGGLLHRSRGSDDNLCSLLGTTTSTPLLLGGATTLLLDIHHTPNNKDEYDGVYEKTEGRRTTRGG